jgi:hypothetical protein
MFTIHGKLVVGTQREWVVSFENGQSVHIVALDHVNAVRLASRAICQPAESVTGIRTKEGLTPREVYDSER